MLRPSGKWLPIRGISRPVALVNHSGTTERRSGVASLTNPFFSRVSALKAGKANHNDSTNGCYFCAIMR